MSTVNTIDAAQQIERARAQRMTHYVPAFTRVVSGKQETVCGQWASPREIDIHTPTCPACRAYLEDEEATAQALAKPFDQSKAVTHVDFDPCSDYTERRR